MSHVARRILAAMLRGVLLIVLLAAGLVLSIALMNSGAFG